MNKYIKHAINSWMTSVRDIPDRLNDDKTIMKARDKMKKQFDKVYWQYHDLVFTYKKAFQSFGSWIRGKGATKQTYGDILDSGLLLDQHLFPTELKYPTRAPSISRALDTHYCLMALQTFTNFLGGNVPNGTLDDCFEDIYSKNPNFARRWVDSLGEIVAYVNLIQAHDPTLELYAKGKAYNWQAIEYKVAVAKQNLDIATGRRVKNWVGEDISEFERDCQERGEMSDLLARLAGLGALAEAGEAPVAIYLERHQQNIEESLLQLKLTNSI